MREPRTERHTRAELADQCDRARLGPALGKPRFITPPQPVAYGPCLFRLAVWVAAALALAAFNPF